MSTAGPRRPYLCDHILERASSTTSQPWASASRRVARIFLRQPLLRQADSPCRRLSHPIVDHDTCTTAAKPSGMAAPSRARAYGNNATRCQNEFPSSPLMQCLFKDVSPRSFTLICRRLYRQPRTRDIGPPPLPHRKQTCSPANRIVPTRAKALVAHLADASFSWSQKRSCATRTFPGSAHYRDSTPPVPWQDLASGGFTRFRGEVAGRRRRPSPFRPMTEPDVQQTARIFIRPFQP